MLLAKFRGDIASKLWLHRKRVRRIAVAPIDLFILVAYVGVALLQRSSHRFAGLIVWGLLIALSFAGWGAALDRLVVRGRSADWGLRAAWGMALSIVAGGLLALLSLVSRGVLVGWVGIGLVCFMVDLTKHGARIPVHPRSMGRWLKYRSAYAVALLPIWGLLAIQYCMSPVHASFNLNDDNVSYFALARTLIDGGSLVDPFSLRRLSAYGGQSYLHAFVLAVGDEQGLHLIDMGLAPILLAGLVLGYARERIRHAPFLILPLLIVLASLPVTRINTASEMTGAVLFLAMFRTVDRRATRPGVATALPLALVCAAACTLRQNYILTCGVFLVATYLAFSVRGAIRAGALRWSEFREAFVCAGLTLAFLLPWLVLSYRSSRTFLFPILPGNYHSEYGAFGSGQDKLTQLKFLWSNATYNEPIRTLPFFLLAALVVPDASPRKGIKSLFVAGALGFFAIVRGFPLSDPPNIGRYYFASLVACVLATGLVATAALAASVRRSDSRALIAAGLVLTASVLQIHDTRDWMKNVFGQYLDTIRISLSLPLTDPRDPMYGRLQNAVPAGEKLLAMLDEPYFLDFHRNTIYLVDLPGAVSPPPGMPLGSGPDAAATYLLNQGIRYYAFVGAKASKSLYRRDTWERQKVGAELIWRIAAPFYLDTFRVNDELAATRRVLFNENGVLVVDLATPATAREPATTP
ncbi:hypothetical protein LVJ94_45710 [Pendulispora rubella]|uniref:Glycosyltransferase RgtA/B/C/D-like domain-containing protein n=1 Tax=Pendulispora rubella TaxID=2741070 RepID=A0ABZ2L044_9BACT